MSMAWMRVREPSVGALRNEEADAQCGIRDSANGRRPAGAPPAQSGPRFPPSAPQRTPQQPPTAPPAAPHFAGPNHHDDNTIRYHWKTPPDPAPPEGPPPPKVYAYTSDVHDKTKQRIASDYLTQLHVIIRRFRRSP